MRDCRHHTWICYVIAIGVLLAVGFVYTGVKLVPVRGTIFSPRYSETAFRQIKPGMTRTQVLHHLGPPLSEEAGMLNSIGKVTVWSYTKQRNDESWWLRREVVIASRTGRVYCTYAYVREP